MAKLYLIKKVNEIKLIKYFYSKDNRGDFSKIFSKDLFYKLGFKNKVAQINISTNLKKGTIRGFHYQKEPKAQNKIIAIHSGQIIDFAVDINFPSSLNIKNFQSMIYMI